MARLSPNAPLRAAVAYPLQNCVEFPILERVRNLALTNGDVHDNWPPKEFSGFLDMIAQGGLPATLQRMLSDKDYFRSEEALGPAYERAQDVTDETIETYLRPFVSSPQRTHDLERFILAFPPSALIEPV